jgi:hypothetical protein
MRLIGTSLTTVRCLTRAHILGCLTSPSRSTTLLVRVRVHCT